jgi:hypothetical protein
VFRSDGCCDCLYDDVSVECIVVADCRTNRELVKRYLSAGSKSPLTIKFGGDVKSDCNLGMD